MIFEIIKIALGASIPLLVFYFGKRWEQRQHEIERRHKLRIQFELEAEFFGPQRGYYVTEISMILNNHGHVRTKLNELLLTVKGIEADSTISLLGEKGPPISMADFPSLFVNTNVLIKLEDLLNPPENGQLNTKEWFVEPGISQRFSYIVRIPESISFILVRSKFKYHFNSEHSAQKVFEVNSLRALE